MLRYSNWLKTPIIKKKSEAFRAFSLVFENLASAKLRFRMTIASSLVLSTRSEKEFSMHNDQASKYTQSIQNLIEFCKNAKDDRVRLTKLREDPLAVLQSLDIPVEDEFKEAVISQLRAIPDKPDFNAGSEIYSMLASAEPEAQRLADTVPAAPTGLRVVSDKEQDTIPPEVRNALEFQVKPWGLVLVVREPAIKYLKGGGAISATLLALLSPIPIAGAIALFLATFLGINLGVIEIMDQGKGVYITLTWAHIFLCGVGLLVPAITPIK